ncbi:uncharacterized protein [Dysidea avara]|uniref:uncharacterized protein isoform X2 n=1 Tax=Dysidea avara TaxID=196820 RepID=UPI003329D577
MVPKTTCQHVQLRLEEGLVLVLMLKMSTLFVEYVKAASSQVQREIKVTFEDVFQYVINCWLKDSSKFGAINNKYLLLGLSQLSFFHEPTDLQLFINSGILQLLGNLLSSQQAQLVAANDDKKNKYVLNERVVFSCSQLLQLIAVRTGGQFQTKGLVRAILDLPEIYPWVVCK